MQWLFDFIFPPNCLICKKVVAKKDDGLCAGCFDSIPLHKTFFCAVCGNRLPDNQKICHKSAPYLLAAATNYDNEIVRKLVWLLKYRGKKQAAKPLARMLATYIKNISPIGLICPIPLHQQRERERGFNQSQLIAERLAEFISPIGLIRVKNSPPQQKSASYLQRKENIESAFSLALPVGPRPISPTGPVCPINPAASISGKTIFLLDDVSTTGATLNEAAKVLKAAGAKKIIGLVVAKV